MNTAILQFASDTRRQPPKIKVTRKAHREAVETQLDLERLLAVALREQAGLFRALSRAMVEQARQAFAAGTGQILAPLFEGDTFARHIGRLTQVLAAGQALGWVRVNREAGLGRAEARIEKRAEFTEVLRDVATENAVRHLRSLPVVEASRWESYVQKYQRRAFTAAGVEQEAALRALRNLVADGLERGITASEFEREARVLMAGFQTRAGSLRTLWNTQIGQAMHEGREEAFRDPEVSRVLTHRLFDAMIDFRVRPNHRALDNGIARSDWPGWATYGPLLGFNCRCTVIGLTAARARRMIESGQGFDLAKQIPAGAGPDPGFIKRAA